jgi:hypothetical protein
MSNDDTAPQMPEPEFWVEDTSEEALVVLLLATFKSHMNLCELQYKQGNKQALMVAMTIYFGLYQCSGRPPPEWLSREFNAACLKGPRSWDDVFGKPVRGGGNDVQVAFETAKELQDAGVETLFTAIADKIRKSEGTARALYYDDRVKIFRRGKSIADKFGLHMKHPEWDAHLHYALGFGSLAPVLDSAGTLRIYFYPIESAGAKGYVIQEQPSDPAEKP